MVARASFLRAPDPGTISSVPSTFQPCRPGSFGVRPDFEAMSAESRLVKVAPGGTVGKPRTRATIISGRGVLWGSLRGCYERFCHKTLHNWSGKKGFSAFE